MIDYVHLSYRVFIPERAFNRLMWTQRHIGAESYFIRSSRGVHLRYYPTKFLFTIEGKMLMLLYDTQVLNVDDIYGSNTDQFIRDTNDYLNHLFPKPYLDIRDFYVKRIDYCFNVETEHVKTYLDFLNVAFERCNGGRRINHVQERHLNGSIYVKTESDYKNNSRRNYVLNFYDKEDCLQKKKASGEYVAETDFEYARNILRLEIQCGYQFIDQLCNHLNIPNHFGCLFDYKVAFIAEEMIYSRIFSCSIEQDFFSYLSAKELLPPKSEAARKALYDASTNHSIRGDRYKHGRSVIKSVGVYPYCFLSKECSIERMDNPVKLIQEKLEDIGIAV